MNNKINLKDVTFLIPLRLESIDRLENILLSTNFLHNEFECNIHVLEISSLNNGVLEKLLYGKVKYSFIQDKDPIFYKTKYLNILARKVITPILSTWDADVIIPQNQILEAVQQIRNNFADFAYPYDGSFLDTSKLIKEYYFENQNIEILINNKNKMKSIYGNNMVGGAVFAKTSSYIEAGMENEEIYGWGPEDFERYERWKLLDYKIYKSIGCLFHLTHSRTNNSEYRTMEQAFRSNICYKNTLLESKDELKSKLKGK